MTLTSAVAILNRNKFWGYGTWHVEGRGMAIAVVPAPGGFAMTPETAIKLAETHPHDDGRAPVEPPDKSAEVMKTWGFNAQTLLSFVANMTDSEKEQLVNLLWPAIAKRLPKA